MEQHPMNVYALIILFTLVISFVLNLIINILNLKSLKTTLPNEFNGVYDADDYRKSQEYTRVRTKFGFLTSSIGLIITIIFWFAGGFNYLDQFIRSWELGPIWTGLIYIGILMENVTKV